MVIAWFHFSIQHSNRSDKPVCPPSDLRGTSAGSSPPFCEAAWCRLRPSRADCGGTRLDRTAKRGVLYIQRENKNIF